MDIIASLMVLPNRMCIPLIDQVKVDQMRFPLPRVCKIYFPFYALILNLLPEVIAFLNTVPQNILGFKRLYVFSF